MKNVLLMASTLASISMAMAFTLSAAYANEDIIVEEGAVECLEWDVETLPAHANRSGCPWYKHDKVSTRFVVKNHCPPRVSGVFTYFRENLEREAVMTVQAFAVGPGRTEEVANPCNMSDEWSYHISRISY